MRRRDQVGLAVDDVEADVHLRHRAQRLDQRVADEVGERHLAAAGAGEVVVDDDAVVPQQLDRDRADAGGRRDGQAGVHVLHGAGGGAAQHGVGRLVGGLGLRRASPAPWAPGWCSPAGPAGVGARAGASVGLAAGFAVAAAVLGGGARRGAPARLRRAAVAAPWPAGFVSRRRRRTSSRRVPFAVRRAWCLKKSHHTLSTLFGSRWYCSYISSTSHSFAPNAARGLSADSLSTGDAPFEDSATAWIASSDEFL